METRSQRLQSALRLPYTAHTIFKSSLQNLQTVQTYRAFNLPPTKFSDEVTHYAHRHRALRLKGPRPILRKELDNITTERFALQIDSSLSLLDLAKRANPLIKPIILYYSTAQLFSVYARAFFTWQQDSRDHGIKITHDPKQIENTKIHIQSRGHFPRLVTATFLQTGVPSCFNELVCYSSTPIKLTGAGERLENFGKNEIGIKKSRFTLDTLINLNPTSETEKVRTHFSLYDNHSDLSFMLLTFDLLLIFVASSIARYNVYGWRQILEGKSNVYKLSFDSAFDRFIKFGIDYVIDILHSPPRTYKALSKIPSPYTNNKHAQRVIELTSLLDHQQ